MIPQTDQNEYMNTPYGGRLSMSNVEISTSRAVIVHSFRIKGREYSYSGPIKQETQELLGLLENMEEREQNQANNPNTWLGNIISFYNQADSWLLTQCSFERFDIKIDIADICTHIIYWCIYFAALGESINIKNNPIIENDSIRSEIASNLPLYGFLYTFGSLICQYNTKILIWIVYFIGLLIIPLFAMLNNYLNLFNNYDIIDYNYYGIGLCIVSIMIFGHSLINGFLLYYVKEITNKLFASFINCSFCLLISYFIIFKIIAFIILIESLNSTYIINNIKDIIAAPMFLGLLLLSIILLIGVFQLSPNQIISDIQRLQVKPETVQEIQDSFLNYKLEEKIISKIKRIKLQIISPLLISLFYISLELYCYGELIEEMSQTYIDYEMIITFSVLLAAIPIFFMLGTCISNTNIQIQNLYLWVPLLIGGASTLITIKIWNLTYQNEYISSISRLIGISPLIISLIWLTVGYFRSERRNQKMFVMFITCYFFAFPLGFLLTLSDAFDDIGFTIGAIVLIFIGLIPLVFVILYYAFVALIYLYNLPSQAQTLNFQAYEYIDLSSYAHWVNSIGYIIGAFFLSYFIWNEPETATGTKKGTIEGLLAVHTLLFILTNYALGIPLKKQSQDDDEQPDEPRYNKQEVRMQQMILAGSLLSFIILLPVSLTRESEKQKTAILVCAITFPIVFQYFRLLNFVKQDQKLYYNFTQPLVIIFMWLFIIGPIGIVFPIIADMFENSSDEFAIFAQFAVAYTILIIILTVTIASIFQSVLLNKEQLEKQKKAVLRKVMQFLANHGVKSTEDVCSLIFIRYIQYPNLEKLKNELQGGILVNVVEYIGTEINFDLKLVTKQDYENIQKFKLVKEQATMTKNQRRSTIHNPNSSAQTASTQQNDNTYISGFFSSLQDLLYDCLFCRYGTEELDDMTKQEKQKLIELNELKQWKEVQNKRENRNQPSEETLKQIHKHDFYVSLQHYKAKTERFWYSIHQRFSDNIEIIIDYLDLIRDDQILSLLGSYEKLNQFQIRLSIADFAKLLKHNTPIGKPKYQYLWELAIEKYPIFIHNYKDLKNLFFYKPQDTPFSESNYEKEDYFEIFKNSKKLQPMVQNIDEQVELDYQNRQQEIVKKYQLVQPNPFKLKIWKACACMHYWLWIKPMEFTQKYIGKLVGTIISDLNNIQPDENEMEKNVKWQDLSIKVGDKLVEEIKAYTNSMQNQEDQFNITFTNGLAVVLRFFDLYSLATLAFSSQVGWDDEQEFEPIESVDYSGIWSNFDLFFGFALFMSVLYFFLGIQASRKIEKNTFGYDEQGAIATYKDRNFWLSKIIQFISGQFIFVMKTYIDVFICDYNEYPYTLVRQPSVQCMSDLHFMYVVFALIGCLLYYPLSTFLQPNFQFSDHSLNLKYKSSYVVLYIQAKLLILGLSSVFSNLEQEAYLYQMLFSSLVMASLIYAYYRLQPCYIKWFNYIEICFLFLLCFFYFSAFLIMVSKNRLAGGIFLAVAGFLAIVFYGYQLYVYYKNPQNTATKIIPVQNQDQMKITDIEHQDGD